MMNFVGVVAEYNPLHNGHAAMLNELRQRGAKTIAVCMSCALTQRGELAILPDAVRTAAALSAGADMVVALPAPYACSGAESFAGAAVSLLGALGCDTLAFGAETPDAARHLAGAQMLRSAAFSERLRTEIASRAKNQGTTFAATRAAAAESLLPGAAELLGAPNNILGVEYCKAILSLQSCGIFMQPLALPRLGTAHDAALPVQIQHTCGQNDPPDPAENLALASASYLRRQAMPHGVQAWRPFVPPPALAAYLAAEQDGMLASGASFSVALLSRLRGKTAAELAQTRGINEGLEHRLYAAIQQAGTAQQLYALLKSKRYPHARLRRLALDAALGYHANQLPQKPGYLHLLGARRRAMPLLSNATLPAGTSLAELARANAECAAIAAAQAAATDLAALCRKQPMPAGLAFTAPPVLVE